MMPFSQVGEQLIGLGSQRLGCFTFGKPPSEAGMGEKPSVAAVGKLKPVARRFAQLVLDLTLFFSGESWAE